MKNFKVAQIVPVAQLGDIKDNQYHMCLAHLVDGSDPCNLAYIDFYKTMSKQGKYVLMDNGAAEGSQLSPDELIVMYEKIRPTEIVCPDTLCDSVDTLRKTLTFIEMCSDLPYKFMAVPQGKDLQEWKDCASVMLRNPRINSIGISKFLNIQTGDNTARYYAVQHIHEMCVTLERRDIEVHLLGCDEGPTFVRRIQEEFAIVRGCDTAFGYIACQSGTEIKEHMSRPKGEIDFLQGPYLEDYNTYAEAIEVIMCGKENSNGVDYSWR